MTNPLLELLAQSREPKKAIKYPTIEAQKETLKEYLDAQSFNELKVGDFVKLSRFGKQRYQYPDKKQVAIVTHVFDTPQYDNKESINHCVVAVVFDSHLQEYAFNFANLEKI